MLLLRDYQAAAAERPLTQDERDSLVLLWKKHETERLALDRQSKASKQIEDDAKSLLLDQLIKHKGLAGRYVAAGPFYEPHVNDWEAFQAHVQATGDFSLVERRVGKAAVKEQWDAGKKIPGVEKYPVYKLSVSKD